MQQDYTKSIMDSCYSNQKAAMTSWIGGLNSKIVFDGTWIILIQLLQEENNFFISLMITVLFNDLD